MPDRRWSWTTPREATRAEGRHRRSVGIDERVSARYGRFAVGLLGRAELIANKRAAGCTKDLLDIALLEEVDED